MKKILALGGSNSKNSINAQLAEYIANELPNVEVLTVDWSTMELPLFSPHLQQEIGAHPVAERFKDLIQEVDGIVLSLAEYNAMPTAAFKNLWDWTSRSEVKFWAQKPMFLASTAPGPRGGMSALSIVKNVISHYGGNVIVDFTLPQFRLNFENGQIILEEKAIELKEKLAVYQQELGL